MAVAATFGRGMTFGRQFWLRVDPTMRIAIAISLVLHIAILAVRFKFPEAFTLKTASTLEVVLVNSKTEARPQRPDVLAQANLDGGGNTDERRRAKTPLPAMPKVQPGTDLVEQTQRRVTQLEEQQRQLLAQASPKGPPIASTHESRPDPVPQVEPVRPEITGQDLAARALAMARLEAQIARDVDEYNRRPRKQFVGARAAEVRFAQYVEDWRQKIERVGNANYPSAARGRIYGSLRMTVAIRADGTVESIEVDRPSGHDVLDRAAERIVKMAAPYAVFPPEVRRDTDILVITRTWIFAPGDRLQSE